nr:MAG TPA: hypothetical protein [Caudoviricetes sp.]
MYFGGYKTYYILNRSLRKHVCVCVSACNVQ